LGRDAQGPARGNLGGQDSGDPGAIEFGHIAPARDLTEFRKAIN
jgi:hypothetical protein